MRRKKKGKEVKMERGRRRALDKMENLRGKEKAHRKRQRKKRAAAPH
jgi:hypothetical protein